MLPASRCPAAGPRQQQQSSMARRGAAAGRPSRRLVVLHAAAAREDVLLRTISASAEVSVLVVDGTQLVAEAASRHKTAPTSTAALGRALLGALLLGAFRKDEEQLQITFKGDGPAQNVLAIANTRGDVKGLIANPLADPPLRPDGKLDVGAAVGKGVLAVVRSHPADKQPYTGLVPIVSGEIAEDLANYLVDSEQTNSALGLGVSLDRDCNVKSAGGWLVQILPFCSEETLSQLETNLGTMPSITKMLNDGLGAAGVTARILEGLGESPDAQSIKPRYGPCDDEALQLRMMRVVASLGRSEVEGILKEQGKVEVTCDLCQQTYTFDEAKIFDMVSQVEAQQQQAMA